MENLERKKEILEIITENVNPHSFAYDHEEGEIEWEDLGLYKPNHISYQIGNVDDTSYAHNIVYFEKDDTYIKLSGWYSSYSGMEEWDDNDYSIVQPVQKTVTIYK